MRRPTAAKFKKTALGEALQISLLEEVQNLLGADAIEDLDFEGLETALRHRVLQLAARALEQRFNRDTSDAASGTQHACTCGQMARYVDRRSKCFQTVLGELTLERAYYYCPACHSGFCPRDPALGLDESLSPGVVRMIGVVGTTVSFEQGSGLLKELAGLHVVAKQVERTAESLAPKWPKTNAAMWNRSQTSEIATTLYLGLDGTGIPVRPEELKSRPGKQEDGSAKTREVKLCTIWSAESRDEEGVPIRDPGSVTTPPPSKARPPRTPMPSVQSSTNGSCEKPRAEVSIGPSDVPFWVTVLPGLMRYAEFHAQGLCTSTGVVEAGLQSGYRRAPQTVWHALECPRSRCDYRLTMPGSAAASRISGNAAPFAGSCMTARHFHFLVVHPHTVPSVGQNGYLLTALQPSSSASRNPASWRTRQMRLSK